MNTSPVERYLLRPTGVGDIEAITTVWHSGWREADTGHVPGPAAAPLPTAAGADAVGGHRLGP